MNSTSTTGWKIHDGIKVRFHMTRRGDQDPCWLQRFPEKGGSGCGDNVKILSPIVKEPPPHHPRAGGGWTTEVRTICPPPSPLEPSISSVCMVEYNIYHAKNTCYIRVVRKVRLPGFEPGLEAWEASVLTAGLQSQHPSHYTLDI